MNLLELHIIQRAAVNAMNNGEDGSPKMATVGGVTRARVASQSHKRAIRTYAAENYPQFFGSIRTKNMPALVELALEKLEAVESAANFVTYRATAERAIEALKALSNSGKSTKEGEDMKNVMTFLNVDEVCELIKDLSARAELDPKSKKKATPTETDLIFHKSRMNKGDIALFGRMFASAPTLTADGAVRLNHALTTHAVSVEYDLFTAVDDLSSGSGAGFLSPTPAEFVSGCYYRYIAVDLDLLFSDKHLGCLSQKNRQKFIEAFIDSVFSALPTGKKTSKAGVSLPEYMYGVVRKGAPMTFEGAFENAVPSSAEGYFAPSVRRLKEHRDMWNRALNTKISAQAEFKLDDNTSSTVPEFSLVLSEAASAV